MPENWCLGTSDYQRQREPSKWHLGDIWSTSHSFEVYLGSSCFIQLDIHVLIQSCFQLCMYMTKHNTLGRAFGMARCCMRDQTFLAEAWHVSVESCRVSVESCLHILLRIIHAPAQNAAAAQLELVSNCFIQIGQSQLQLQLAYLIQGASGGHEPLGTSPRWDAADMNLG